MKKLIFAVLACLIVLTGCGSAEKATTPQPDIVKPPQIVYATAGPSETPEPTPRTTAIDCPYSSLGFEGRDVNAQHYPRSYSTIDAELISKIWNIISSDEREEVSDFQGWEDPMRLTFLGQTTERVNLQLDDYCELVDSGKKYALAPGSYSAISELLTEYTTENYSFIIDENFLNIDTSLPFPIEFYFDQTQHVSAMSSEIGDFTENWVLIPLETVNLDQSGRFAYIQEIYTKEGYGPVEVSVRFDELLIGLSCDGVSKWFSTNQETIDSIESLLASLENR